MARNATFSALRGGADGLAVAASAATGETPGVAIERAPVIIEVAVNGVTTPERNPNVAASPEALAADALR